MSRLLKFIVFAISLVTVHSLESFSFETHIYKVKEEITPPHEWFKVDQPLVEHKIHLRIGLPLLSFSELEKQLYEVSDPDHHRYGQHLSKAEVEALITPSRDSVDAVDAWLSSFGLTGSDIIRSPANDWVTIKVPIGTAEKMLDTKYYVWQHKSGGDRLVRTTSYSLPTFLHKHIDVVQPTTIFNRFQPHGSTIVFPDSDMPIVEADSQINKVFNKVAGASVDASCNRTITISCLQQLYNTVGYVPSTQVGNSIGITGYLESFANLQDLQLFYSDQHPDAINSTFEFISVNGGQNNQTLSRAGAEANLDVQFAFGISYPVASTFYSTAGRPPFNPDSITPENTNEPYMEWLDYLLSHPNPPLVISTSYGDSEQTVPESYATRICAAFAQLGARGVTLFFSSGDRGVGDGNPNPANQTCFTNDGQNATRFIPSFPASCPYVTAVGGTTGISPEVAVTRFYSGGGFSNYFPQPDYQKGAVDEYLKSIPVGVYRGLYNPQGRAYPDVAAQGDFYKIFLRGKSTLIGGTSASSPTVAGIIALLNDIRLREHLPPLGFLNPFIYSKGLQGFNDVTTGNAAGCGTVGFNASTGWDPGYGTPNFLKLKDLVLNRTVTYSTNTTGSKSSGSGHRPNCCLWLFLFFVILL